MYISTCIYVYIHVGGLLSLFVTILAITCLILFGINKLNFQTLLIYSGDAMPLYTQWGEGCKRFVQVPKCLTVLGTTIGISGTFSK